MTFVMIGGGRMGLAMLSGAREILRARPVVVCDPAPKPALLDLAETEAWSIRSTPPEAPAEAIVLAVKPQDFAAAAGQLRAAIDAQTLVISVMAGLNAETIAQATGARRVLRAMPNTPAVIGAGVTGLWGPSALSVQDWAFARAFFKGLGMVAELSHEGELEALTAISGCGPAYVFLLAEALSAAGVKEGLAPELAERLARQTVIGAGALLAARSESAGQLREEVTSPKGVTAEALAVLGAQPGLAELMAEAVAAARRRARELARA